MEDPGDETQPGRSKIRGHDTGPGRLFGWLRALLVRFKQGVLMTAGRPRGLEVVFAGSQALGMLASLAISRSVGPAGRGNLTNLVVWAQLLGWIAVSSLDKGIAVLSREGPVQTEPGAALAWARRVVNLPLLCILAVCVPLGTHLFHSWKWTTLLAIGVVATCHAELVGGWLLGSQKMAIYVIYRFFQPVTYFVGTILIVWGFHGAPIPRESLALALVVVISLMTPVLVTSKLTPWSGTHSVDKKRLLRFSLSAQVANAMQYLNSRLDVLTLSLLATSRQVGLYAAGVAVGQATVVLGSAGIVRGLTGSATKLDKRGVIGTAIAGLFVATICPIVIPVLFGDRFVPSIRVAQIIAVGGAINFALQSSSGRLLGAAKPWRMALAEGAGTIAFALGIFLSRALNIVAISSVISYGVAFVVAQVLLLHSPTRPEVQRTALLELERFERA
jgi:hypothetical protein